MRLILPVNQNWVRILCFKPCVENSKQAKYKTDIEKKQATRLLSKSDARGKKKDMKRSSSVFTLLK